MRSLKTLYHCFIANICLWWGSWIINSSRTTYFSIQAAEVVNEHSLRHRFKPAIMYVRYYFYGRYWTPVLIKVNPRDLPLRRPRKLGRRWGGDIRRKAF